MTQPLNLHHQKLEQLAASKKRKNIRGLPIGAGWYAKRNDQGHWIVGYYSNQYDGVNYHKQPFEKWIFQPIYVFAPNVVCWNPAGPQMARLRAWSQRQTERAIPSPKYEFNSKVVQGTGMLFIEHDAEGVPHTMSMSGLPEKKVWDKEKYLQLRRQRVKAERILRGICKMGGFDGEAKTHVRLDPEKYLELLKQVVDEDDPSPNMMKQLAAAVQGRIEDLARYRWIPGVGSVVVEQTAEKAFASLRDELRESSYKLKKVYTYEPFDDGRHTTRFDS